MQHKVSLGDMTSIQYRDQLNKFSIILFFYPS